MPTTLGPLAADVTTPEAEKFTAPLLLLHGLWDRAPAWRRFAGYLAHRGWHCIALERRGDAADLAAQVADLRAAIAALPAPPVIVGHDLGALLALHCADAARAVIALAPLVGPPIAAPPPVLLRAGTWLARRRGAPLRAPRAARTVYPRRDLREPAALVQDVLAGRPPLPPPAVAVPRAVFAVEDDDLIPAASARVLAHQIGAELHLVAGTRHAVLTVAGWESCVAAVHRWIIQRLGVDLLAMYEEAMQPE